MTGIPGGPARAGGVGDGLGFGGLVAVGAGWGVAVAVGAISGGVGATIGGKSVAVAVDSAVWPWVQQPPLPWLLPSQWPLQLRQWRWLSL